MKSLYRGDSCWDSWRHFSFKAQIFQHLKQHLISSCHFCGLSLCIAVASFSPLYTLQGALHPNVDFFCRIVPELMVLKNCQWQFYKKVPEFRDGLSFDRQRERERNQCSHVRNAVNGTSLVPVCPSGANEDKLFSTTTCCARPAFVGRLPMQLWARVRV